MEESAFPRLLSSKQKDSVQGKPPTRQVWEIHGLSLLKALLKASDRADLPSIFLVLYTFCLVNVLILGDPVHAYVPPDFRIALTTNRMWTSLGILRDKHGEILSQGWWPQWCCTVKMSMVGRPAAGIRDGSLLRGLLEERAALQRQERGSLHREVVAKPSAASPKLLFRSGPWNESLPLF